MEEIRISEDLKGVIVFAEPKCGRHFSDWLVLMSTVSLQPKWGGEQDLRIHYFICLDTTYNRVYFSQEGKDPWGFCSDFNFYHPTKEQKMMLTKALAKKGYKYVSSLGKVIRKV